MGKLVVIELGKYQLATSTIKNPKKVPSGRPVPRSRLLLLSFLTQENLPIRLLISRQVRA